MRLLHTEMQCIVDCCAYQVAAHSFFCADTVPYIIQKTAPAADGSSHHPFAGAVLICLKNVSANLTTYLQISQHICKFHRSLLKILVSVFLSQLFVEDPVGSIACHKKDLEDLAGADKLFVDQGLLSLEIADELDEFLAVTAGF